MNQIYWPVVLLLPATSFSSEFYRIYNIVRILGSLYFNFLRKTEFWWMEKNYGKLWSFLRFAHWNKCFEGNLIFFREKKVSWFGWHTGIAECSQTQETFRTKSLTKVIYFSIFLLPWSIWDKWRQWCYALAGGIECKENRDSAGGNLTPGELQLC